MNEAATNDDVRGIAGIDSMYMYLFNELPCISSTWSNSVIVTWKKS